MNESLKTVINAVRAVTDSLANKLTGVEKKIPKVDTGLNKRGFAADSEAVGKALKRADTKISNAQTAANNAQSTAENAHIIVEAVKSSSDTYSVTIDGFTIKTGAEITIIPKETLTTTGIYLSVNGDRKEIRIGSFLNVATAYKRVDNQDTTIASALVYCYAGKPTKLMYNGTFWIIQNVHSLDSADMRTMGMYAVTTATKTAASTSVKVLESSVQNGQIACVQFINGNTATYPKLKSWDGVTTYNILDETGNPIQSMPVPAGATRFFIFCQGDFYMLGMGG